MRLLEQLLRAITLCGLLMTGNGCWADTLGRIVGVVDGDTVDILTPDNQQVRVRLAGIDAPEKRQPFATAAKKLLSELAFDRQVRVEGTKRDRYGRLIGKLLITGMDVNLEMIRRGMAWHYKKYANEQSSTDRLSYADAQDAAQTDRLGLWQDEVAVAPWDFRAQRRGARS